MATLLMRLQGTQSWGDGSRFTYYRETADRPTKSGVLGLVACALGRGRDEKIIDLAVLRFGVRVDVAGGEWMDFHTVQGLPRAGGGTKPQHVTQRFYLSPETTFLVGLEGDKYLLRCVQDALREPVWMPYLGRRACVPMAPIWLSDGLREEQGLQAALRSYPWLGRGDPPEKLLVELPASGSWQWRQDQPLRGRRFAQRSVRTFAVPTPSSVPALDRGLDQESEGGE